MCTVQEAVSVIKNHIKMVADLQVLQYLSVGILFILVCFPRCLIFGDLSVAVLSWCRYGGIYSSISALLILVHLH